MGLRLIVDTSTAIWFFDDSPRLSSAARSRLTESVASDIVVSAASVWEASIKVALGKLDAPDLLEMATNSGFTILPITGEHARAAGALPPHHNDPFDRMLVAQSMLEGLPIVTSDPKIRPYDVTVIW